MVWPLGMPTIKRGMPPVRTTVEFIAVAQVPDVVACQLGEEFPL
jgi:hypothetical protein